MSSEPLENNIARLVRQSALPIDESRQRRADFLRAAEGSPPEAMGRRLAVAAAALVVCGLLLWAAKTDRRTDVRPKVAKERPALLPAGDLVGSGGNDLLKGTLTLTHAGFALPKFLFRAKSMLPDGVQFKIRPYSFEETWDAGRIVSVSQEGQSNIVPLKDGRFEFMWESSGPRLLRLAVGAPDDDQDVEVMKTLNVKAADRAWTFEYLGWDESLLPLLGPQLVEVGDLTRELHDLIARVETSCASEAQFLAQKDALIRDAQRLQTRTNNFATTSVYPAALRQISYTARDLATSIPDFKWLEGKYQGPSSYYTEDKKKRTFRQDPFEFAALRKYLDEAEVIAGREFGLWIVKDLRRIGLQDAHRALVTSMAKRPGVSGFEERLLAAAPDPRLEENLRTLAK